MAGRSDQRSPSSETEWEQWEGSGESKGASRIPASSAVQSPGEAEASACGSCMREVPAPALEEVELLHMVHFDTGTQPSRRKTRVGWCVEQAEGRQSRGRGPDANTPTSPPFTALAALVPVDPGGQRSQATRPSRGSCRACG